MKHNERARGGLGKGRSPRGHFYRLSIIDWLTNIPQPGSLIIHSIKLIMGQVRKVEVRGGV